MKKATLLLILLSVSACAAPRPIQGTGWPNETAIETLHRVQNDPEFLKYYEEEQEKEKRKYKLRDKHGNITGYISEK